MEKYVVVITKAALKVRLLKLDNTVKNIPFINIIYLALIPEAVFLDRFGDFFVLLKPLILNCRSPPSKFETKNFNFKLRRNSK